MVREGSGCPVVEEASHRHGAGCHCYRMERPWRFRYRHTERRSSCHREHDPARGGSSTPAVVCLRNGSGGRGSMTLVERVEAAWNEVGIHAQLRQNTKLEGRLLARVSVAERERAFLAAIKALDEAGCRTCAERDRKVWSVYGFSEAESIAIDLTRRASRRDSF